MTLAPTVAISTKDVQSVPLQRSMRNPISLLALSSHAKSIRLLETTEATRLLGAFDGSTRTILATDGTPEVFRMNSM